MFEFMYTFDYDSSGRGETSSSPMVFNVKVYSIADKYDVQALKLQAKKKFMETISVCWDMDDFPDAVAQVYCSTPTSDRGLREAVSDITCKNIDRLFAKERFEEILEETTGFASDVVKSLAAEKKGTQSTYKCNGCDNTWKSEVLENDTYYYCIRCGDRCSDWASKAV